MKIRHPAIIKGIGLLGAVVLRGLMRSMNQYFDQRLCGEHPADHRKERFIYCIWHEAALLPGAFHGKVHVLISQHADGEILAQLCKNLRVGTVRGSTTRGGIAAMMDLIRVSKQTHLLITPDGPRGPRRVVQPGIIYLAARTGLPIVPIGVSYKKMWRANSWDRFMIPCPFTDLHAIGDVPIVVPPDLDLHEIDYYRRHLENRMNWLSENAERWAKGLPRCPEPAPTPRERPLKVSA